MPSSRSCQNTRRLVCWLTRKPSAARKPEIIRASWDAVAVNANSAKRCSSITSTTRVTSRTFEYDNRPARNSSAILGMRRNALATRTCSRATPGVIAQLQDNQCASDLKSFQYRMASRASNSPSSSNNTYWDRAASAAAALIRPANPPAYARCCSAAINSGVGPLWIGIASPA
jgi:hypothetical protein